MHLDKYHDLAVYLKKIAVDCELAGRNHCTVDKKVLVTASAAIDELLLKVIEAREEKNIETTDCYQ